MDHPENALNRTGPASSAPSGGSDSTPRLLLTSTEAADLRIRIVAEGRALLGTPFRHQGRMPGRGLDCAGLAVVIGQKLGLPVHDRLGYGHFPAGDLIETCAPEAGFSPIAVEQAAPGDFLLFRFDGEPRHVALMTDRGILHAYANARRVVEHGLDASWRDRISGAWSFSILQGKG